MKHLGLDYRVSLLRAAAFHGSAHQAAMVFQVIAPRQLPKIEIGRQRVEFLYQAPAGFAESNRPEWLAQLKTEAGFAKIAGVELTLLDICRYFHRRRGSTVPLRLSMTWVRKPIPASSPRRPAPTKILRSDALGYLLERFGHIRQANVLHAFAEKAKSFKDLDPAAKPIVAALRTSEEKNPKWKLIINVPVEIDA